MKLVDFVQKIVVFFHFISCIVIFFLDDTRYCALTFNTMLYIPNKCSLKPSNFHSGVIQSYFLYLLNSGIIRHLIASVKIYVCLIFILLYIYIHIWCRYFLPYLEFSGRLLLKSKHLNCIFFVCLKKGWIKLLLTSMKLQIPPFEKFHHFS